APGRRRACLPYADGALRQSPCAYGLRSVSTYLRRITSLSTDTGHLWGTLHALVDLGAALSACRGGRVALGEQTSEGEVKAGQLHAGRVAGSRTCPRAGFHAGRHC